MTKEEGTRKGTIELRWKGQREPSYWESWCEQQRNFRGGDGAYCRAKQMKLPSGVDPSAVVGKVDEREYKEEVGMSLK